MQTTSRPFTLSLQSVSLRFTSTTLVTNLAGAVHSIIHRINQRSSEQIIANEEIHPLNPLKLAANTRLRHGLLQIQQLYIEAKFLLCNLVLAIKITVSLDGDRAGLQDTND